MAEWTDNASGVIGHSQASLFEQWQLNGMINDRCSQIHRIDEDIDRLEQGLNDIDHSISSFEKAASDMETLRNEVVFVFKGESAEAFIRKIESYLNFCLRRKQQMESLKANYQKQISDLKYQKEVAQRVLERLRDRLEKLRNCHFHSVGGNHGF